MAAEALQQIGAGLQRRKQIEAPVGPAGALAHPVLHMDHEAGAGVLLAEAGGYNAHHPLMPAFAGEDQRAAVLRREPGDFLGGVSADGLLHLLALPVQIAELSGQGLRQGGIAGLQQVRSQVRFPHTAGGVDPGRKDKADLDGGDGLAQEADLLQQGVDPHEIRVGQGLQPAGDDGAVFPPPSA